jgi:hypothetical protein
MKYLIIKFLRTIRSFLNFFQKIYFFLKKYLSEDKQIASLYEDRTFKNILSPFEKHIIEQNNLSYEYFKKFFLNSQFFDSKQIKKNSILKAKNLNIGNDHQDYYYLEFGVFKGNSINYLSKFVDKIYGFDSFTGLEENWTGTTLTKGAFNLYGIAPKVRKNVTLINGIIQKTLPIFLKTNNIKISFMHIDVDTYETTKFILDKTKPYMNKNAIILFDEFYNFHGWQVGEFKALKEVYKDNEYEYNYFSIEGQQVTIQLK